MSVVLGLYNEILYRPLFNGLIFIYSVLPVQDIGLAIIILTFIVRLILFPSAISAFKNQASIKAIQPKLKAIQNEFRSNKEEQVRRIMALYAEHKVNPFSGCLPLLIQLPILIALYQVFWKGLNAEALGALYSFVSTPASLNVLAFGLIDISRRSIPLAVLAGFAQFIQARLIPQPEPPTPKSDKVLEPDFSKILSLQVKYFFPILIAVWSLSLPAALPLYWTIMSFFAIVEQILMKRMFQ